MKKHIFIFAALFTLAVSSCSFWGFVSVDPSGQYITKKVQTTSFENVSVSSGFELILTQDSLRELSIETYENIQSYIVVEVVDNTLRIHPEEGINFSGDPKVKIHLSCNILNKISSSGGGRINLNNGWTADELRVSLSGGGNVIGKVLLKSLELDMSGGSESDLEGVAEYLDISSSGGSIHKHFSLLSKKCRAHMSGGASAEVNVSEKLIVEASGGTNIRYKGNPEISSELSGGSSIEKVE
jgi:hypothetical protein